jgi:hypothetical protein
MTPRVALAAGLGASGKRAATFAAVAMFLALVLSDVAAAETPQLLRTYRASDYSLPGRFGQSITPLDNQSFLIGAPDKNTSSGVFASGAVVLVNADTGASSYSLANPHPAVSGRFGVSAAFAGSRLAVGANDNNSAGEVLVYGPGATLERTLSLGTQTGEFGYAVAGLDANRIVVGDYRFGSGSAFERGGAFVYDVTTGTQLRMLANPTPAAEDHFAFDVAGQDGGKVLMGAHRDDTAAVDSGAAYRFDATTGALLNTYLNPDAQANAYFGISVGAVGPDKLLVGAIGANGGGAAYLLNANSGALLHKFVNPTPTAGDNFGERFATIGASWFAISAAGDDTGATDAGAVYIYDQSTYQLVATINNPAPSTSAHFGYDLSSFRNSEFLVGAFDRDVVYRYVVPEPGCAAIGMFGLAASAMRRRRPRHCR